MVTPDLTAATWQKSSRTTTKGACVEVAALPDDGRSVRDSKDPQGPALMVTAAGWAAFTAGVCAGEFG